MQERNSNSGTVDCGWLMALSESVQSAISALAGGDLQKFEIETKRQSELLQVVLENPRLQEVAGDGGAGECARDQHQLCAVLAHQISVLGRAVQRSLRAVNIIRALQPSPDGTYAFLVGMRRP